MGLKRLAQKKFAVETQRHHGSSEFAACLPKVYHTTPDTDRGLRNIVIGIFRKSPELLRRKDVEESVRCTPDLAFDLCLMGFGLPV